jgi:hypothetical protein
MVQPPRLSAIFLPWENSVIYFVTMCVQEQHPHWPTPKRSKLRKELGQQKWQWQRGCFDRLLRSDENLGSKWIYVQDNPVRAGFVARAEDRPFYLDLVNDGKLTASLTEAEPGKTLVL